MKMLNAMGYVYKIGSKTNASKKSIYLAVNVYYTNYTIHFFLYPRFRHISPKIRETFL